MNTRTEIRLSPDPIGDDFAYIALMQKINRFYYPGEWKNPSKIRPFEGFIKYDHLLTPERNHTGIDIIMSTWSN